MKKLTDHVYGILKFGAYMNSYVIDHAGALTIVDTGLSPAFAADIENGIKSIGKSLDDVRQIFITHCHNDHVGGLHALQKKLNVPTYAHRMDARVIRGEQAFSYASPAELGLMNRLMLRASASQSYVAPPCRVDIELNGGETLDAIAPHAQVIPLAGHSFGQIGLWLPDEKSLIGGDVLMHAPWGLNTPFRAVSPDWAQVKASIQRVAELGVANLFLGHGKPLLGGADAQIKAYAAKLV